MNTRSSPQWWLAVRQLHIFYSICVHTFNHLVHRIWHFCRHPHRRFFGGTNYHFPSSNFSAKSLAGCGIVLSDMPPMYHAFLLLVLHGFLLFFKIYFWVIWLVQKAVSALPSDPYTTSITALEAVASSSVKSSPSVHWNETTHWSRMFTHLSKLKLLPFINLVVYHRWGLCKTSRRLIWKRYRYSSREKFEDAFDTVLD